MKNFQFLAGPKVTGLYVPSSENSNYVQTLTICTAVPTRDLCCLQTASVVWAKLEQLMNHLWLQHLLHQVAAALLPNQPGVSPVGWRRANVGVHGGGDGEVGRPTARVLKDVVQLLLGDQLSVNVDAE